MPRTPALALAALLALAGTAHAQLADGDRTFLRDQAQGTAYEMAIARLAQDKATRPDIRTYAQTVIADHTRLDAQIQMVARDKKVDLPADMTARQKTDLARLQAATSAAFDRAYLEETTRVNAEDKKQDQAQLAATTDTTIRQFVLQLQAADATHEAAAEKLGATR